MEKTIQGRFVGGQNQSRTRRLQGSKTGKGVHHIVRRLIAIDMVVHHIEDDVDISSVIVKTTTKLAGFRQHQIFAATCTDSCFKVDQFSAQMDGGVETGFNQHKGAHGYSRRFAVSAADVNYLIVKAQDGAEEDRSFDAGNA